MTSRIRPSRTFDGDFADAVLADAQELLGGDHDGALAGVDLDLGRGVGQDRHAAVGQDLGRADRQRHDLHGQGVDRLQEGHDERPAAQPDSGSRP